MQFAMKVSFPNSVHSEYKQCRKFRKLFYMTYFYFHEHNTFQTHGSGDRVSTAKKKKKKKTFVIARSFYSIQPECPYPVFKEDTVDVCYFFYDPVILGKYKEAEALCDAFDALAETQLAQLDSQEKVDHVKTSGLFDTTP